MSAIKTAMRGNPGPAYTVTDSDGNTVMMHQRGKVLVFKTKGGELRLTQTNATDLLPGIQAFSTSGVVG